ncbi:MAG: hypothetical protein HY000_02690 [Planctomycetes bacterium]|nr:hypothetical protein [Planctomycetota bacterium]
MKTFIGLGALFGSSLLFAGAVQACGRCRCTCSCPPAATGEAAVSAPGTTDYARSYGATEEALTPRRVGMPSPSLDRPTYLQEYQRYRQGR